MFEPCEKSTGVNYTLTVALLALAFVFSPAVLVLSGRTGHVSIGLATAVSAFCIVLARINWTRHSRLTIPSIETPDARAR